MSIRQNYNFDMYPPFENSTTRIAIVHTFWLRVNEVVVDQNWMHDCGIELYGDINVYFMKICSKHSNNTPLSLLWIFMKQTLKDIEILKCNWSLAIFDWL